MPVSRIETIMGLIKRRRDEPRMRRTYGVCEGDDGSRGASAGYLPTTHTVLCPRSGGWRHDERLEAEDGPVAEAGDLAEPAGGGDRDRSAHRFEELEVAGGVRIAGRGREVEPVASRDPPEGLRLVRAVTRLKRDSGEHAVDDLARGADRTVEAEVVGDVLDDLVQAGGDDVRRLARRAVSLEQGEGLGEEQRP